MEILRKRCLINSLSGRRLYSYLKAKGKRFYKEVNTLPTDENVHLIQLDGRTIKTPLRNQLYAPTPSLAAGVANEWQMQTEEVNSSTMPLTTLCNTVIDNPTNASKVDIVNGMLEFLNTDTICTLADSPESLAQLQQAKWLPVVQWLEKWQDISIVSTTGLFGCIQPEKTVTRLREHLMQMNPWQIYGLQSSVDVTKSLILPLALAECHITCEQAIYLSRLEIEYQIEKWGNVEFAHELEKLNQTALLAASILFYRLTANLAESSIKIKMEGRPDFISRMGFKRARSSHLMFLTSAACSLTVSMLPRKYFHMMTLDWVKVAQEKQVWRIFTSQFIHDSSFNTLCTCMLVYNFIVIERRLATAKFVSFLLSTWSMSLAMYFGIVKSQLLKESISHIHIVPSGLYSTVFASLIYYYTTVARETQPTLLLGGVLTKKVFVYSLALQLMFQSRRTILISTCGMISGLLYQQNVLNIQRLTAIPKCVGNIFNSALSFFYPEETKFSSRKCLMGATPEIQEDMITDYTLRVRDMRHNNHGFVDISNPILPETLRPPQMMNQPQILRQPEIVPQQLRQPEAEQNSYANGRQPPDEEKVQLLIDMGFNRVDVVNALLSTENDDVQSATAMLLAA